MNYKNKGKHDKYRLIITKRQYSLEVVENSSKTKVIRKKLETVNFFV